MTSLISDVLKRAAEAGDVPGVAAIAAMDGRIVFEGAYGRRDLSKPGPMTPDTVVWIASMTKAVTAAALMQQVEQGRIRLDQPAKTVLPALGEARVLEGFDHAGAPRLRVPKSPITVRQLLTHTAGFSYELWNADIQRYLEVTGTPGIITCEKKALTTPLIADPGTTWEYGIGIDFCGRLVEALSGTTLDVYLRDNILGPLGMHDTAFKIGPGQRTRLARAHARTPEGLVPMDFELVQSPEFHMGGGGLYGTVGDYLKFTQMILDGGKAAGGRQILKPETVAEMSRNQIGALEAGTLRTVAPAYTNDANFFPNMAQKWGLSFLINTERSPQGRSAGSLAWAGLANTYYWIDPKTRVTGVYATQIFPFADVKSLQLFRDFEAAVYRSV